MAKRGVKSELDRDILDDKELRQKQKIIFPSLEQAAVQDEYDWAWLNLKDLKKIKIPRSENPLLKNPAEFREMPGLDILQTMRNPDYLHYAAKILLNVQLLPFQAAIIKQLWTHPFPMFIACRGASKSYLLAVYALLKAALCVDQRIVIVGAGFRQARVIYEYCETIWRQADILRDICSQTSGPKRDVDRCMVKINDNTIIAIPLGTGEKIRGLRATTILSDEFGSIPPDIYETVVVGFAAVSSDPVANVKETARREAMGQKGIWTADDEMKYNEKGGNQAIISGTASYDFEHFHDYWHRYKTIIKSKGDPRLLHEVMDEDDFTENFNWKDYCVVRVPYELVPEGFMDDKVVARAKATIHIGIYDREYSAVFVRDSSGFFKRSLIESCTAKPKYINEPNWPPWCSSPFAAMVRGSSKHEYVFGIDPASERDNFSIVVLELHKEHTRVVYCWTTNRKDFRERVRRGMVAENDFYSFCARKIRDLMKVFPCAVIAMDAMGGGIAVEEALHDPDKFEQDEVALWPTIDSEKPKDTDNLPGRHILELCQFAKADWTSQANHGLRKDLEDKVLLFPNFDSVALGNSAEDDKARQRKFAVDNPSQTFYLYDSLEDCMLEIEALKDELCTIVMTRTGTGNQGRDRWDTPEYKTAEGKKAHMRKDRYSSIVMANMVARSLHRAPPEVKYDLIGGRTHELATSKEDGPLYTGPEWFTSAMNEDFLGAVKYS